MIDNSQRFSFSDAEALGYSQMSLRDNDNLCQATF